MSTDSCPSSPTSSSPCSPCSIFVCSPTSYPTCSSSPGTPPDSMSASSTSSSPTSTPSLCPSPSYFSFSGTRPVLPKLFSGSCCSSSWCTRGCSPYCSTPSSWFCFSQTAFWSVLPPFPWWFSFHLLPFSRPNPCSFRLYFPLFYPWFLQVFIFVVLSPFCWRFFASKCCPIWIFSFRDSGLGERYLLLFLDVFVPYLFDFFDFVLFVFYFLDISLLMEFQYSNAIHDGGMLILCLFELSEGLEVCDFVGLGFDVVVGGGYFFWRHRSFQ